MARCCIRCGVKLSVGYLWECARRRFLMILRYPRRLGFIWRMGPFPKVCPVCALAAIMRAVDDDER